MCQWHCRNTNMISRVRKLGYIAAVQGRTRGIAKWMRDMLRSGAKQIRNLSRPKGLFCVYARPVCRPATGHRRTR